MNVFVLLCVYVVFRCARCLCWRYSHNNKLDINSWVNLFVFVFFFFFLVGIIPHSHVMYPEQGHRMWSLFFCVCFFFAHPSVFTSATAHTHIILCMFVFVCDVVCLLVFVFLFDIRQHSQLCCVHPSSTHIIVPRSPSLRVYPDHSTCVFCCVLLVVVVVVFVWHTYVFNIVSFILGSYYSCVYLCLCLMLCVCVVFCFFVWHTFIFSIAHSYHDHMSCIVFWLYVVLLCLMLFFFFLYLYLTCISIHNRGNNIMILLLLLLFYYYFFSYVRILKYDNQRVDIVSACVFFLWHTYAFVTRVVHRMIILFGVVVITLVVLTYSSIHHWIHQSKVRLFVFVCFVLLVMCFVLCLFFVFVVVWHTSVITNVNFIVRPYYVWLHMCMIMLCCFCCFVCVCVCLRFCYCCCVCVCVCFLFLLLLLCLFIVDILPHYPTLSLSQAIVCVAIMCCSGYLLCFVYDYVCFCFFFVLLFCFCFFFSFFVGVYFRLSYIRIYSWCGKT